MTRQLERSDIIRGEMAAAACRESLADDLAAEAPDFLSRQCARLLSGKLRQLAEGRLTLTDGSTRRSFGPAFPATDLHAEIVVQHPHFYVDTVLGGSVGAAEAYAKGYWDSPDVVAVVRLFARNREVLLGLNGGFGALTTPLRKATHAWHRNTRQGARRNIAAHYDLGNEFFALWLDPTMMYSAAIYETRESTLEEAAVAKLDRVCRKLDLQPGDEVLEIGTGWGGFAIHAARYYGCRVTTTTISEAQYEGARERVAAAGLNERVHVLRRDYRDLRGTYDKLVSIEMIEAIGAEQYEAFFAQCSRLLKPDGCLLLQAITIEERAYEAARRNVDFIKRYIFPGSCIPSLGALQRAIGKTGDLRLTHLEDLGRHYARTLADWRRRFHEHEAEIRSLGFGESFLRLWDYYFSYCEGGFHEGTIGVAQMLLQKPRCRQPAPLGELVGSHARLPALGEDAE